MTDKRPIRVIFFGTALYAAPCLERLTDDRQFEVVLAVTQPDRPAGRGHKLVPPPVKVAASAHGLPIIQPTTLRDESVRDQLRAFDADLFVVAAYGLIFGQAVLDIPRFGSVNLHASLLPMYRGAAPIPAAILNGDTQSGMTLMKMERGLDTGPIISQSPIPIMPADTTESLTMSLASLGAEMAATILPDYLNGRIVPTPQREGATIVRRLTKDDGQIDWTQSAEQIERQIRAMWPWPRAWTTDGGITLQIHEAIVDHERQDLRAGSISTDDGRLVLGSGAGALIVQRAQLAGGRPLSGAEIVRGRILKSGIVFEAGATLDVPLVRSA